MSNVRFCNFRDHQWWTQFWTNLRSSKKEIFG